MIPIAAAAPIASAAMGAMGGGGAGGVPQSSLAIPSRADSSARSSTSVSPENALSTGAGNRGFYNIVAFPGSSLTADAGAAGGAGVSTFSTWLIVGLAAIAAFMIWRMR